MTKKERLFQKSLNDLNTYLNGDFEHFVDVFCNPHNNQMLIEPEDIEDFCEYILKHDNKLHRKFAKKFAILENTSKDKLLFGAKLLDKYGDILKFETKIDLSYYMASYDKNIQAVLGVASAFLLTLDVVRDRNKKKERKNATKNK